MIAIVISVALVIGVIALGSMRSQSMMKTVVSCELSSTDHSKECLNLLRFGIDPSLLRGDERYRNYVKVTINKIARIRSWQRDWQHIFLNVQVIRELSSLQEH